MEGKSRMRGKRQWKVRQDDKKELTEGKSKMRAESMEGISRMSGKNQTNAIVG
jgi:hypothetical protein